MNNKLFQNKFILTAVGISLFILLLILLVSPKRKVTSQPLPSSSPALSTSNFQMTDLSKEKRDQAITYVDSISTKLPLGIDEYKTTVGIITSINIFHAQTDPPEVVRLEIYGLSYINKNELDEKKNPNVTAFKESYTKAIELLESQNIDPKRLIFYYSDVAYVRETANEWVSKLKLLQ